MSEERRSCKTCIFENGPSFDNPCLTCHSPEFNNWKRKGEVKKDGPERIF